MPSRALIRRVRSDESGFTLIEVLVSAVVVVIVSLGVMKSLDTANARSGYQKHKGVAAGLAQQDQERLRAFRAQDLNNYVETRCVQKRTAGFVKDPGCDDDPTLGINYKIISRTDWVSDQSGTRSCGTGARADYIRISSTVSWANPSGDFENGLNRVSIASIVAPRVGSFSGEGSLSIEVRDRNGTGRPNVPVTVTGPKALSGTTDANGCLLFGYLPQGNYTVAVAQTGNVDKNGNTNISQQFGVSPGSITTAVIEYDVGANLNVSFSTRKGGATVTGQKGDQVSISHPSLASPTWRTYDSNEPSDRPEATYGLGTAYAPQLFPFTSGYSVYSGNCPGNRPSFYGLGPAQGWPDANVFATLNPGGTGSITVHEPTVRLDPGGSGGTVWPGSPASIPSGAIVGLKPETTWGGSPTLCSDTKWFWTLDDASSGTGAWLYNFFEPAPYDYGVPVGAYDLCVIWPLSPGSAVRYRSVSNPTDASGGLQPLGLGDGPSANHEAFTVAKPTDSSPTGACT